MPFGADSRPEVLGGAPRPPPPPSSDSLPWGWGYDARHRPPGGAWRQAWSWAAGLRCCARVLCWPSLFGMAHDRRRWTQCHSVGACGSGRGDGAGGGGGGDMCRLGAWGTTKRHCRPPLAFFSGPFHVCAPCADFNLQFPAFHGFALALALVFVGQGVAMMGQCSPVYMRPPNALVGLHTRAVRHPDTRCVSPRCNAQGCRCVRLPCTCRSPLKCSCAVPMASPASRHVPSPAARAHMCTAAAYKGGARGDGVWEASVQ